MHHNCMKTINNQSRLVKTKPIPQFQIKPYPPSPWVDESHVIVVLPCSSFNALIFNLFASCWAFFFRRQALQQTNFIDLDRIMGKTIKIMSASWSPWTVPLQQSVIFNYCSSLWCRIYAPPLVTSSTWKILYYNLAVSLLQTDLHNVTMWVSAWLLLV